MKLTTHQMQRQSKTCTVMQRQAADLTVAAGHRKHKIGK